jgi:hypothetical protein
MVTQGLGGFKSASVSIQPCRKHPRVVEYDQVSTLEQGREVYELPILDPTRFAIQPEQS